MFLFCKDLTCHFVYTCQFSNEFNDLACFYRAVGGRVFIPSSVSFGHGGPSNMCVVCDVLRGAGRKKNKGLRESPFVGYKTAWRCQHSSVQSGILYRRHTFFCKRSFWFAHETCRCKSFRGMESWTRLFCIPTTKLCRYSFIYDNRFQRTACILWFCPEVILYCDVG